MSLVGNFRVKHFLVVVCSIFRGSFVYNMLILINLLQVVSPESESGGGSGTSAGEDAS